MDFNLIKNKNFSLLLFSSFISLVGTQMQNFALSLYVLKITGSATLFASVLIAALIPQILFSPITGVLTDWLDRKRIIIYIDFLSCLIVCSFAVFCIIHKSLPLPSIYILAALLALASSLYQPAIGTVIPSIIKKDDLIDANSMNSIIKNICGLIAPLLAGVLFPLWGLLIILLINAISFFLSAISEIFIDIPKANVISDNVNINSFTTDFKKGINFIKKNRLLLYIIILAPILNFVFEPLFSTGVTYICKKLFKISDLQYGFMQMLIMSSLIAAPLITNKYTKKLQLNKLIFINFLICSVIIGIMAIIPSPLFSNLVNSNLAAYISFTIICFLLGIIITSTNIALSSMFQKIVSLSMMGIVGTVMNTCCIAAMPLGLALFGVLYDSISAWLCVLISAIILMVTILIFRKPLLNFDDTLDSSILTSSEL